MQAFKLRPVDNAWFVLESSDTPLHVGVLAIFRKPRNSPPDYLGRLVSKMREVPANCAPWNCRLAGDGSAGVLARLVEVRDVDLNYHFHRRPYPRMLS